MLYLERVNMLKTEEVKQAFVKAIEIVGISAFKRTSIFMRNNIASQNAYESKAA